MSARVIQPGETPQGTIGRLAKRLGAPAVRAATRQAMRLMGSHFVLGETIEAALVRAQSPSSARAPRYSFDMLGEGARTAADAARYFNSYRRAIDAIGRSVDDRALPDRPGISVKLSALHPRFEAVSHGRVMAELAPLLLRLARQAKSYDLNFARRHRRGAGRKVACRLGRLWACDPGLSEARRRGDRLCGSARARA
jgi:RHH-type proline utilization regulon transcriptional repressor/proline dehydrogenase/delta 1-pyrroline-5-carboxylate dehydrogenase